MSGKTRHEAISELTETRRALTEARRQLAQSATERETELRDCLTRVVRPGVGPGAKDTWRQAIEDGKRLVDA